MTCTVAAAAALAAAQAHAASVTVTVSATIHEVPCTAEQRLRIRACAPSSQSIAPAPFKSASIVEGDRDGSPIYRIEVDPTRQVLIRTVLY